MTKPDRRQSIVDRRKADAQAQAERVALLLEDRRSSAVRRAVKAELEYFDNLNRRAA
jgi:hypothetical protein